MSRPQDTRALRPLKTVQYKGVATMGAVSR